MKQADRIAARPVRGRYTLPFTFGDSKWAGFILCILLFLVVAVPFFTTAPCMNADPLGRIIAVSVMLFVAVIFYGNGRRRITVREDGFVYQESRCIGRAVKESRFADISSVSIRRTRPPSAGLLSVFIPKIVVEGVQNTKALEIYFGSFSIRGLAVLLDAIASGNPKIAFDGESRDLKDRPYVPDKPIAGGLNPAVVFWLWWGLVCACMSYKYFYHPQC